MIPKYDEMYCSILHIMSDRQQRKRSVIRSELADRLHLSDEDLAQMTSSGKQSVFSSNSGWAITYLNHSGLLERVKQGVYVITDRGMADITAHPDGITNDHLSRYIEFRQFVYGENQTVNPPKDTPPALPPTDTPEQMIQKAINIIDKNLAEDLLAAIMENDPRFFEQLVIDLLENMGYGRLHGGSAKVTQYVKDGGIDGIINEDKLGLSKIYVQAKRWSADHSVSRPDVQQFVGALPSTISKGIFITTSSFTEDATKYAKNHSQHSIILINGTELANLMIEYNLGVSTQKTYTIKRIDTDYFNQDT